MKYQRKQLHTHRKCFADTAENKEESVYRAGLFTVHEMMDSNI